MIIISYDHQSSTIKTQLGSLPSVVKTPHRIQVECRIPFLVNFVSSHFFRKWSGEVWDNSFNVLVEHVEGNKYYPVLIDLPEVRTVQHVAPNYDGYDIYVYTETWMLP